MWTTESLRLTPAGGRARQHNFSSLPRMAGAHLYELRIEDENTNINAVSRYADRSQKGLDI
jgi:hypothetical protein